MCGVSLKLQCIYIGVTYALVSMLSLVMSSMMLHSPIQYINLDSLHADASKENFSMNVTDSMQELGGQSTMDKIEKQTGEALHNVGATAIEMLVESVSTLAVSVLLIHGVREEKTAFMFPWVIVTILLTVANFITFIAKAASPGISAGKVCAAIFYFSITAYFILCVQSYYQITRIKKKKALTFLDTEFQGGEGNWYHSLREDRVEDIAPTHSYLGPAPAYSDVLPSTPPPQYTDRNPFRRPPPFTEKAVPMNDEEDNENENVLYLNNK